MAIARTEPLHSHSKRMLAFRCRDRREHFYATDTTTIDTDDSARSSTIKKNNLFDLVQLLPCLHHFIMETITNHMKSRDCSNTTRNTDEIENICKLIHSHVPNVMSLKNITLAMFINNNHPTINHKTAAHFAVSPHSIFQPNCPTARQSPTHHRPPPSPTSTRTHPNCQTYCLQTTAN